MSCIRKADCDARCLHYMMDKSLWKELCEEFNKWCSYEEVEGMTYAEGRNYIENMPVWIPM